MRSGQVINLGPSRVLRQLSLVGVSPRTSYRRPLACVKGIEMTLQTLMLIRAECFVRTAPGQGDDLMRRTDDG